MLHLSGGAFDIFRKTAERRIERQPITAYENSFQLVMSAIYASQ
ncbi:MAG: hypothetical protein ABI887_21900 [Burkholderiales bacterium]